MSEEALERILDITFNNKDLLSQATTLPSFVNENRRYWTVGHNERLEFLGDSVIDLVVAAFLMTAFPEEREGSLTRMRMGLVRTETLAIRGEALGLYGYLRMSQGDRRSATFENRQRWSANAYEAIVGALFLDQGYEIAAGFVHRTLLAESQALNERGLDPQGRLQEMTQAILKLTPTYRTTADEGQAHERIFIVGVYFGDELIETGRGTSTRRARVEAARRAMRKRGWT
jgi:ribonuclease-3